MWGNAEGDIENSILKGRSAVMIPWEPAIGVDGVDEVTEYVLKLAGRDVDEDLAVKGQARFGMFCAACHGADGKGQKIFGAPDLTNEIWLYGNSRSRIAHVIGHGRNGIMPSFEQRLGKDKVHILAGYVKSLSTDQ